MKRMTSILMAAALLLSLCAPVLAAEEAPAYRLTQVTYYSSDGRSDVYTLVYNGDGVYPDELQGPTSTWHYTYDEQGRLTADTMETEYTTTERTYAYDEAGNMVETTRNTTSDYSTSEKTTYTYDENGVSTGYTTESLRKTSDGTEMTETYAGVYSFDASGRKVSDKETWTSNGETTEGEITYEYAEDGTMTTSDGETYTYDEQGRELTYDYDWGWATGSYVYTYAPLLKCTGVEGSVDDQKSIYFQVELVFNENATTVGTLVNVKEPALTFDDNGYLVKADAGDGNYMEFTYEQVG